MDIVRESMLASTMNAQQLNATKLQELSSSFMNKQPDYIQQKYTESLAVFDRQQNHIGSANWYFVHYFGFHYSATAVIVFSPDCCQYLLQHRADNVSWPNLLDCSAGGCCPDNVITEEQRIQHAQQELSEELFNNSSQPPTINLIKLGTFFSEHQTESVDGVFYKRHFIHYYRGDINTEQKTKLTHNNEIKKILYLTKAEILNTPRERLAPGLQTAIDSNIL